MKYRVILNHDQTYYFKSLKGVFKFIKLLKEETDVFDDKVEISVDNYGV